MIPLSCEAVADVVGGVLRSDSGRIVTGVSIDSRTVREGDLFVALQGARTDGHDHIDAAVAAGAAAYLCADGHPIAADGPPGGIVVDDPLDALTGLGAWMRDEVDPVVVAITGSNGKTTTKDLAAAAIGAGRITVANPGSFNNELGLPLTLCLLTADTEVLVCEVGSRGRGHIAAVMPMLRPDVAVVTTIAGAHIGEFGSLEAIAVAKGELVEGLNPDGTAILNADVPEAIGLAARAPGHVIGFGTGDAADFRPDEVTIDATATATMRIGEVTVRLPVPGRHQVGNALAALAAATAVGVPLDVAARGLAAAGVSPWRMEVTRTLAGVTVVNDAYNANPASVIAALDTLAGVASDGRRWAVLGYMAELGDEEQAGHAAVGRHAVACDIDGLVVVGPAAAGIAEAAEAAGFEGDLRTVPDADAAIATITDAARSGDVVLIKASRSVGLERVATALHQVPARDGDAGGEAAT